jgi:hypothetical protein
MRKINFDDLPNDCKIKIFSINEENNFKIHKNKFKYVLQDIEDIGKEIFLNFDFDFEEYFEDINAIGIGYLMIASLHDCLEEIEDGFLYSFQS